MQQSDLFATILGIITLGGGTFLSTLSNKINRFVGAVLLTVGFVGLIFWFGYYNKSMSEKSPSMPNTTIKCGADGGNANGGPGSVNTGGNGGNCTFKMPDGENK